MKAHEKIRVWHISDTHGFHEKLVVPKGIDIVVHSGDTVSSRDPITKMNQVYAFGKWFGSLDIPYKIFVPGNHDSVMALPSIAPSVMPKNVNVLDLKEYYIEEFQLRFFGNPHSRQSETSVSTSFQIPDSVLETALMNQKERPFIDFFVSHGSPYNYLDVCNYGEHRGSRIIENFINTFAPSFALFGHSHDPKEGPPNFGHAIHHNNQTFLVNSACWNYHEKFLYGGHVVEITRTPRDFFLTGKPQHISITGLPSISLP